MGKPIVNRLGDRYGMLEVIGRAENYRGNVQWLCRCKCGVQKIYIGQDLAKGKVRSCGCNNPKYHTEHGMASTPTYRAWINLRRRCNNPKCHAYKDYGARGITVCESWNESFEAFLADMGPRPEGRSLDRIDNSRGYEPGNCRWTTMKEQLNNTRANRFVEIDGERLTVSQWCDKLGIPRSRIKDRLKWGWTIERAITTPARPPGRPKN